MDTAQPAPARRAAIKRATNETRIAVELALDGTGAHDVRTGIGFIDHMLEQLSPHSITDLKVRAEGDLHLDLHHKTAHTGITIVPVIHYPERDRPRMGRYGHGTIPVHAAPVSLV